MRKVGVLERDTGASDNAGGIASTWTASANGRRRIGVKSMGSQVPFAEGQLQERITHEVRTRYFKVQETGAPPSIGDRWLVDGSTFLIRGVLDTKLLHRELVFRCEERKAL